MTRVVGWILFSIVTRMIYKAIQEHEDALNGDKS